MRRKLEHYNTLVFDCDGVVLNSNYIKTKAFYDAALPFGEDAAKKLVEYHREKGGISRYQKFRYFLEVIVNSDADIETLLESYASKVYKGLLNCEVASGLKDLRKKTSSTSWVMASGGDQSELKDIFEKRNLASLFDGGIFGSPAPKKDILIREKRKGTIGMPALYLGDSKYDFESAKYAELDFVFISGWSELEDWREYCISNSITHFSNLQSILKIY